MDCAKDIQELNSFVPNFSWLETSLSLLYSNCTMLCFRSVKAGKPYSSGYEKAQLCIQAFKLKQPTHPCLECSFCVCVCMKVVTGDVHVGVLQDFLECLHVNNVSVNMVCNYLSACKAKFIMCGLSTVSFTLLYQIF